LVEIGGDWLKIAQVSVGRDGAALASLHVEKIEAVDSALSARIAAVFRGFPVFPRSVVACLPRQTVNIRMLELPSLDPREIVDMVDLQSAKQTPYSQEEIVYDYRVIGEGRKGYSRIMLAIAQRSILRQRFFVLEEAGIQVERMCVSTEGLLNWYARAVTGPVEPLTALLDVDSSYSDFLGLANGAIAFTKSILIGANQLLDEFDKWKDKFAREVQQALEVFQAESAGASPVRLIITGAGAGVRGLSETLRQHVSIPVDVRDSIEDVVENRAAAGGDMPPRSVSLTPLIGMGIAPDELRLNLVPDSVRIRRNLVGKARRLAVLGTLLMAALLSLSLFATTTLYLRKACLAGLRAELERNQPAAERIERAKELLAMVDRRGDWRFGVLNLMASIHDLTADVALDAFEFSADKAQVLIEGSAATMKEVSALKQRLEQTPEFKDVLDGRATVKDEKTERYRFQVVCTLEKR